MENSTSREGTDARPHYYVGLGASAGGLEALDSFFTHMDPRSGMSFIVIQHLSPDYKSMMVELLSKRTEMTVYRAEEGMIVQPNAVYLIPPRKNLSIFHGRLLLTEQDPTRGLNLPIDVFFRSLADDQGEKAIGIILSGTGSDGVRGVRAIKEAGGMVMVQSSESARFDGMPRSAISTGLADFVLPPEEMPDRLVSFARHPYAAQAERSPLLLSDEDGLTRIFAMLRERTGVDFTFYKSNTVVRRIERRMSVNQSNDLRDYVRFMENHAGEVVALYRELLIGVTSFFRDREVYDDLAENHLPRLFERANSETLRFWVAGCSTGEEAYSLAILSREVMERMERRVELKIFATDIDRDAITLAGNGIYPESIAADLSPRLLAKYFHRRDESYQVDRSIREMVVFAQHNLIKDPPFTNIDLLSCRNLLIYLQPVLQRTALGYFSFSLNPGGILLLGTSETVGDLADHFDLLHAKFKIYGSKGKRRPANINQGFVGAPELRQRMPSNWGNRHIRVQEEERLLERFVQSMAGEFLPLSVVVNEQMEVQYILGDASCCFQLPAGKVINDITKMASRDLAIPLATGLQKVFGERQEVKYTNVRLHGDHGARWVQLRIRPMPARKGQDMLAVVIVEETSGRDGQPATSEAQVYDLSQEAEQRIHDLELELQFTRENLQATVEELETSNEELQATNEELLASNEELQSTNEELQSVNEELHTVNAEYQRKIIELTEVNNDLVNLMASTRVATLFLDENLDIRRFTPEAKRIFKVLEGDVGRPVAHLNHNLHGVDIMKVIATVQEFAHEEEMRVTAEDGSVYLMRVLPYGIGGDNFSGVVLTFVDISRQERAEEARLDSEQRYRRLYETMAEGVIYQDRNGQIVSANPAAERILGLSWRDLEERTSEDPRWQAIREDGSPYEAKDHPSMVALATGLPVRGGIMGLHNPRRDETRWIRINAMPLFTDGASDAYQVYTTFDDITDLITTRRALQRSQCEQDETTQVSLEERRSDS
jgi:two-component system, chemotaxis family, CheB/CheR fusion protein